MGSPRIERFLGGNRYIPFGLNLVPRVLSYPSTRRKKLGTRLIGAELLPVVTTMDTFNQVGHLMFITQLYTRRRKPFMPIYWAHFLRKVRKSE